MTSLLLAFLLCVPGQAEIFYYKDEKGSLVAVDSMDMIPEKYREVTQKLDRPEANASEATIQLVRQGNSLLIPVTFGSSVKALMVLDTGASVTMVSRNIAAKLKLQPSGWRTVSSAIGVIQVGTIPVPEVSVQNLRVKNLTVTVQDLPVASGAEGLLGLDFLGNFKVQLDSASGTVHLQRK